jgi:hypothetical protein
MLIPGSFSKRSIEGQVQRLYTRRPQVKYTGRRESPTPVVR